MWLDSRIYFINRMDKVECFVYVFVHRAFLLGFKGRESWSQKIWIVFQGKDVNDVRVR